MFIQIFYFFLVNIEIQIKMYFIFFIQFLFVEIVLEMMYVGVFFMNFKLNII